MSKRMLHAGMVTIMATGWLTACEVDRGTGERTLGGAAVGAAAGDAYGLLRGDFLGNAVGGAAAGAAGGFVYDQVKRR